LYFSIKEAIDVNDIWICILHITKLMYIYLFIEIWRGWRWLGFFYQSAYPLQNCQSVWGQSNEGNNIYITRTYLSAKPYSIWSSFIDQLCAPSRKIYIL
jgi:hypothetical protein